MSESALKSVTLPNGDVVTISSFPEKWWSEQMGTGYVGPEMLAPDPNQPRKFMDQERLAGLRESIAASGVRETIVVTPLSAAPWTTVDDEFKGCPFLIVSGHRRTDCAVVVGLPAVPIEVRFYKSEKEHALDRSLLNKLNEKPIELDEGYEILDFQRKGLKIEELSAHFGMSVPQLYKRMHLTKLHPDLQRLLLPGSGVNGKRSLSLDVGGGLGSIKVPTPEEVEAFCEEFGSSVMDPALLDEAQTSDHLGDDERRFLFQRLLLSVIKRRSLKGNRASEFIKDHRLRLSSANIHGGKKTERYQPLRRKAIIERLLKGVTNSEVVDWSPEEFRRIFELASRAEVCAYIEQFRAAEQVLSDLERTLANIRNTKREVSAEVQAIIDRVQGPARVGVA